MSTSKATIWWNVVLPAEAARVNKPASALVKSTPPDRYKIVAQIDEFYVARVFPDQSATFNLSGQEFLARVDKVYPEITEGTFEIDLIFQDLQPPNIRRGQTLQMELTLGNPVDSLLLPLGGFIQDTGGNWVFVVNESGDYAYRRDIEAGRCNNRYIVVRSGLVQGDRVVTSSYSAMQDVERIALAK